MQTEKERFTFKLDFTGNKDTFDNLAEILDKDICEFITDNFLYYRDFNVTQLDKDHVVLNNLDKPEATGIHGVIDNWRVDDEECHEHCEIRITTKNREAYDAIMTLLDTHVTVNSK